MKDVTLADGRPVTPDYREIDPATGMQKDYVVLSAEERLKGFVRPVRRSYQHVGTRPTYPTRELTAEEHERYDRYGYVAFEPYPEDSGRGIGRYWTEAQLKSGCRAVTTMAQSIAETYARDPKFYSGTYCATCRGHFPVGEWGEFVWDGTRERVGT